MCLIIGTSCSSSSEGFTEMHSRAKPQRLGFRISSGWRSNPFTSQFFQICLSTYISSHVHLIKFSPCSFLFFSTCSLFSRLGKLHTRSTLNPQHPQAKLTKTFFGSTFMIQLVLRHWCFIGQLRTLQRFASSF